jgi:hypothetical protein
MIKKYPVQLLPFILVAILLFTVASCKKDNNNNNGTTPVVVTPVPATATPTKLGLFEVDSDIYKLLYMPISQIGTKTVDYDMIFDTGSGGMVIDANGILPASMITNTGIVFTGDSTVVNGITITSEESIVEYGDDDASLTKVYGNLAYANVTIGQSDGNIIVKRLPFFIYYKGVDASGNMMTPHYFDILGVSSQYDITFSNNAYITSPFSYFDPGTGLTKGFKMGALGTSHFSADGTYVPGVVTLGLTASDLSPSSSGFTMSQLSFSNGNGYLPIIPANITYKGKSTSTSVLFDTGTEPYSYIEDKTATGLSLLAQNTAVNLVANSGFNYAYTTAAKENLTYIENPTTTGANVSIMSLEYFLTGEYMLDFTNHKLGLKNN